MTIQERLVRLMSKVRVVSECWEWQGARWGDERRYGQIRWNGHSTNAHRVFYEIFVGPISPNRVLDHLCRNTICVNPHHLEPVSNKENILRGIGPTAKHARQTHCKRGHLLAHDNLMKSIKGRECRACNKQRAKAWRKAHPTYMHDYNVKHWRKYAQTQNHVPS